MELNLNEWHIEGFLVKRKTKLGTPSEEYFEIDMINLDETIRSQFREILKSNICEDDGGFNPHISDFEPFMNDDSPQKNYIISRQELSQYNNYFEILLNKLNSGENFNLATGSFSEYYSLIVKFYRQSQEFYYFRKFNRVRLGKKKKFSIHEGHIESFQGDFVYFDDSIDFLYFKNLIMDGDTDAERKRLNDQIIIFDRYNFKTLFKLYEYCIQEATSFFNEFDFINIADIITKKKDNSGNLLTLKNSFIHDLKLNEQITRIKSLHGSEIQLQKIIKLKNKRRRKYRFKIIDNKIKIGEKCELEDLLDLIDEKISVPDWNHKKLLRYPSKGKAV